MPRCARCDWTGDDPTEHATESAHPLCIVCWRSLSAFHPQTCQHCIGQVRVDLADIIDGYATLPDVIEATALHPGGLPGGDALVLTADGSMDSPQTPNAYTEPLWVGPTVHLEHPEMPGDGVTLPAYVESRIPSDHREHVRDHWDADPIPVLAVLEANERDWRRTYNEAPAVDLATVTGCGGYLNRHLEGGHNAAQTHPAFDEFAAEIRSLRWRVQHVAGLANDPARSDAGCFDCGNDAKLVRDYRPPVREAAGRPGLSSEGLPDEWTCRRCRRTYTPAEYVLAVRAVIEGQGVMTPPDSAELRLRPRRDRR